MSDPDGRDWFGAARPVEQEPEAGASDWFAAAALAEAPSPEPATRAEPVTAAPGPVPELVAALAEAASAAPSEPVRAEPEPGVPADVPADPESDSRVRLRALTGGLADLSDALAAIGVESVALRNSNPASPPSAPDPSPAADFRVRCPDCGPQYVAVADVRFVETGDGAEANRYLFTCPACGARVRRPAGPELAEVLKSSGVATLALRRGPGQGL